jgi:hypothetical protein
LNPISRIAASEAVETVPGIALDGPLRFGCRVRAFGSFREDERLAQGLRDPPSCSVFSSDGVPPPKKTVRARCPPHGDRRISSTSVATYSLRMSSDAGPATKSQ